MLTTDDYKLKMVDLFKAGKITEARKLICAKCYQKRWTRYIVGCMTTLMCSEMKSNKTQLC